MKARRVVNRAQFQAVLAAGTVARTQHFALHRLALDARVASAWRVAADWPEHAWMGVVTPKRWARRAVTRNAIRRQIDAVGAQPGALRAGCAHVVRLRAAFAPAQYPSATSVALKRAVRAELIALFERARQS
ncbi:MAG: ribonuclease P protein component [Burkholderiaceae bacterium]|jgi:ribonuclease P protein component|nr:ribonuclease P protein component [Burkholderiaceae bacterium]